MKIARIHDGIARILLPISILLRLFCQARRETKHLRSQDNWVYRQTRTNPQQHQTSDEPPCRPLLLGQTERRVVTGKKQAQGQVPGIKLPGRESTSSVKGRRGLEHQHHNRQALGNCACIACCRKFAQAFRAKTCF